ncbi:MAG: UvrD-helicase domain-containing protein, partial [Acidobacteriota bacterium]
GAQVPVGLAVATELPEVAAAVADEVVRLLRKESFRPKDVAVLFRSRTHYRIYEEALAERGVPTYVYRGLGFYDSPEVRDIQALVRFLAEPGSELRAAEFLRSRLVGLSDTGLVELVRTERTRRLEGPLSQLLRRGMGESDLPHTLSPQDRAAAIQTGALVPRWLRQVDRMPPADLLEQILAEADYAAWFADRKHGLQGWENLKKILELIRRAQNRGYLTLSRLADYLDSASTGEESLAVLEAVDAVSLMTIHAAKGLEFDAVFVVNMDQKTRSDTSLPRIKELPDGRAEIHALRRPEWEGPDRAEEEEKRLLYVALTRARKKLILCATRLEGAEGTLTSLRLLPRGLQELMRAALTSREQELVWKSRKAQHRLKILRPAAEPQHYRVTEMVSPRRQALDPLPAASRSRTTVGERAREQAGETWSSWSFDPVDLAIGRVVHRLFEYAAAVDEQLVRAAEALLPELLERTLSERQDTARRAAHFYRRLRQQRGLESLLKSGEVHREVPFALYLSDQIIRGAIDSLVLLPRRVVVIDYKTGGSRPEHQLQMELYVEAARNMFPDRAVEGLVFYPQGDPVQVRPAPNGVGTSSQLKLF